MSKEGGPLLTPQQKAAAVVISLGAERASKIYKYMGEDDLETLTLEIAKLDHITPEQTEEAMDDFYKLCLTQKVITEGGVDYAKTVLEKAFGSQQAATLLERVTRNLKTRAFESEKPIAKTYLQLYSTNAPRRLRSYFHMRNRNKHRKSLQSFLKTSRCA